MPSFLSKVFGRKKQDDKELSPGSRTSAASLLEGKFEAVSPTVSESAEKQLAQPEKGSGGNGGFLQRVKPTSTQEPIRSYQPPPHLTLNLAFGTGKVERPLGSVFAYPDGQITLDDKAIGERRLTPSETLVLVKSCSQAIVARGLETPGIMHPHWYSADPLVQRRLISLFIRSLAPTASSTLPQFDSEIVSTRSPHDVAAVLRWGMRHLQFDPLDPSWYQTFFAAEQSSGYPPNAFSQHLVPLLPSTHVELLTAAIDLFSSLAAHAEANSISGSKISKLLGLWLLEAKRADETDTWPVFYDRWEQAGRKMEHLFLSNIRQETLAHPMPKRLTELVKAYPYGQDPTDGLLPRPRFSTRQYTALSIIAKHPLRIISDALLADDASESTLASLWAKIKFAAQGSADDALSSPASRVFSDETLRYLSLGPSEVAGATTPSLTLVLPEKSAPISRQGTETSLPPSLPAPSNGSSNTIGIDWAQFSTSGFLETTTPLGSHLAKTLMDSDIEKTTPQLPRKPSKKGKSGPSRKSLDTLPPIIVPTSSSSTPSPPPTEEKKSKIIDLTQIEVDEAFIDFWNDALVDPVAKGWPAFVVGKLKHSLEEESVLEGGKKVEWVVIEETFSRPPPPPATATSESATTAASSTTERRARPTSPRPSLKSMTNSSKKRFSFWTGARRGSTSNVRASEMGESTDEGRRESMDAPASPVKKEGKKDKRKSVPPPVLEEAEETKEDNGKAAVTASAAIAGVAAAAGAAAVVAATSAEAEDKPASKQVIPPGAEETSAPVEEPVKEADVPVVAATVPAEVPPEMTPVVEEPALETVVLEPVIESVIPKPSVESVAPEAVVESAIPEPTAIHEPAVEEPSAPEPVVEAPEGDDVSAPALADEVPPLAAFVDAPAPAAVDDTPAPVAVVETLASIEDVEPAVVEEVPVVVVAEPTVLPIAEEEAPIVEETPVVEEAAAPLIEEASVVEAPVHEASTVEETPVVESAVDEPSPVVEEPIEEVVVPVVAASVEEIPVTVEDEVAPAVEQIAEPAEAPEEAIELAAIVVPAAEEEASVVEHATPAVEPSIADEAAAAPEEHIEVIVDESAVEEPISAVEAPAAFPEETINEVEEVVPAPVEDVAPEPVAVEDTAPINDVQPAEEHDSINEDVAPAVADEVISPPAETDAVPEIPVVTEHSLPQDEILELEDVIPEAAVEEAQAEPIVEETATEEPEAELLEEDQAPVTADKRAESPVIEESPAPQAEFPLDEESAAEPLFAPGAETIEDEADEASAVAAEEDNSPAPVPEQVSAVPTEVEAPEADNVAELPEPIAPADSADISEDPIDEVAVNEAVPSEPVDEVIEVLSVHEEPAEDIPAPVAEEPVAEVPEERSLSPAPVEEVVEVSPPVAEDEEEVPAPAAEVVESPPEEQVSPPTDDIIQAAAPVDESAPLPAAVEEPEEVTPASAAADEVEETAPSPTLLDEVAPIEEEVPASDQVPSSIEEPTRIEDEEVAETSAHVEDVAAISEDAPAPIEAATLESLEVGEESVQTPASVEEAVEANHPDDAADVTTSFEQDETPVVASDVLDSIEEPVGEESTAVDDATDEVQPTAVEAEVPVRAEEPESLADDVLPNEEAQVPTVEADAPAPVEESVFEPPTVVDAPEVSSTSVRLEEPVQVATLIEEAAPIDEPVNTEPDFETVSTVMAPHAEPLREPSPEPEADAAVTLPPVPVVEVASELPLVEKEDEKEDKDKEDLSQADTPGPQITLDAVVEEEAKVPPGLPETSATVIMLFSAFWYNFPEYYFVLNVTIHSSFYSSDKVHVVSMFIVLCRRRLFSTNTLLNDRLRYATDRGNMSRNGATEIDLGPHPAPLAFSDFFCLLSPSADQI
ncbi:hypothetical protein CPB85DRAFT_1255379 [Mucidula mucida]|nr:hypothetical protein CPB85DRAFT_1255379 [Mucidula mucida]